MSILFRGFQNASRRAVQPSKLAGAIVASRFISKTKRKTTKPSQLIYPEAANKDHSDLATFLSYVERTSLNKNSTVYRGTHYEYTVADTLSQYGFLLKRVGGHSDRGLDLLGIWTLPSTSQTSKVIIQCKAGARSLSPMYIRELKGALAKEMHSADVALGYVCCTREGEVAQLLWNLKAQEMGLEGLSVGVKYGGDKSQLVLIRGGEMLPLLEKVNIEKGNVVDVSVIAAEGGTL
ncbi:hypothetical protein FCULG_00009942 [Fusarium culmorum]|uniref:Required for respiratory growth protein 7, mitochondrial n=1 Tax=Fusarium culmorum TaxID=5516 RepID=A0A2T4GDP5_FUSCU|nr:hypothetical protein FCULG_00009942 [Fusarium culmorum]